MNLDLKVINPIDIKNWDDLVFTSNQYSFFHSLSWAKVLNYTYGYVPKYFTEMNNNGLDILVPVMEIESWITNKRGVSLPFSDHCPVIIKYPKKFHDLLSHIIYYGKEKNWRYIEFRDDRYFDEDVNCSMSFYEHTLCLDGNAEQIKNKFLAGTKRNIKKAISNKVKVMLDNSLASLQEYYRLHCITRKRQGIPPQPIKFFKNIYRYILQENKGVVALASYKKRNIAGMIFFHYGDQAIYKFGASIKKYQWLRPNDILMWKAINFFINEGFSSLYLGRTDIDNRGLRRFKNNWNPQERLCNYYKYDFKKKSFISDKVKFRKFINTFFHILPLSISRVMGNRLYKHIG